ncbi:MAG: InlB B-repeat-containing protein [Treponema sp.]|nr:InlB B-repeat-containing protein [Treponema sp.]
MKNYSKVFTLMGTVLALAFCIASCKSNVDDDPTMYMVTVSSSIEHGKVSVDKTSAEAGATVKLTATADSGYELDSYSVKDASANALTVTEGTFTMPKSNVTVSATFKETADTVNQKAADAVIAKINAIGTVEYTSESKAKIDEARTAYDALTEAQKALVPEETLALLTAAESAYTELIAAAEQQNPSATSYTVAIASGIANGTVTASPTSATAGTEITLTATPSDGYQLTAFTVTDADGAAVTVTDNKFTMPESNVTVTATFTALPPDTATYTVKHLQQNIADDNYTLKESETKTGTVGQPTAASAKSYDGFTAQTVTQVTVAASGTVVEIKYDRKTYTVTFDSNGGSDVSSQSLRYEAKATKPADPTKTTTEYTFDGWYSDSGLTTSFSFDTAIKEDITLYAKWTETSVIYQFHSTVTYLEAGTDGSAGTEATYAYFGDWPQTVKEESVTVDETKSVTMGSMTYYLGSDNNYYAKCTENACDNSYTYSDGTTVAQASANSEKYFKVEPIKWRVLNPSAGGNKILVAESILTANVAYYDYYNVNRTIEGNTVYPNNYEHSKIRAYLNGLSYAVKATDSAEQTTDSTYNGKGFLQTAFTSSSQSLIATTTVDNSAASTNPASNASQWNNGTNDYACDNTSDKIFLLSEKEATTSDYGFTAYDQSGTGNSRIRVLTDYAKANYAWQSTEAGSGGLWWLRSPYWESRRDARDINHDGTANRHDYVYGLLGGVVPALCLSN